MDFNNMSLTQEDINQCIDHCIDPSLLSIGDFINDPNYDRNTRGLDIDIGFELAPGTAAEQNYIPAGLPYDRDDAPQTPQIQLPQPFEAPFDAETPAQESRRPRLKLQTAPVQPDPAIDITPTTPEIRVSAPGHGLAAPNFDFRLNVTVPPTAVTDDGRSLTTPMQGRPRRNSSPARGRARMRQPGYRPGSPYLSPSPGSSPIDTHQFVLGNGYHVGDRSGPRIDNRSSIRPTSAPRRRRASSVSTLSNFVRNADGRYICNEPECPETQKGKYFDTKSSLSKHQRKHLPEAERPHGCNYCERRFLYPKDLARHGLSHQSTEQRRQEGGTTCAICGNVLSREDNLARHMQRVHQAPPTPSSSGRSRRENARAVSPSLHSAASVSQYSLSRPGTPLPMSPTIQAGVALNEVMEDYTPELGDYTPELGDMLDGDFEQPDSDSPSLAPPMERSKSDFH